MRIVFLGAFTECKKALMLAAARILSVDHTVGIFSGRHYSYEDQPGGVYDFCHAEIRKFDDDTKLLKDLDENACDYALIDTASDIDAGSGVSIVIILEPERESFETVCGQAARFAARHPVTDIHLIFANLLEYCKINRSFLEKLYDRALKDSSNITKGYELYFDEQNAAITQESMYEEKLLLRKLSPVWKTQVANILCDLTGIDVKTMKKNLKKAERMK